MPTSMDQKAPPFFTSEGTSTTRKLFDIYPKTSVDTLFLNPEMPYGYVQNHLTFIFEH